MLHIAPPAVKPGVVYHVERWVGVVVDYYYPTGTKPNAVPYANDVDRQGLC